MIEIAGFRIIMHYGRLLLQVLERQVLFCMVAHLQRVAHRGGSLLAPENTLAAFSQALSLPIDAIELDVHRSHDGQVVVLHDQTVDRVTDGAGNVADLDAAQLRTLNAAAHFPGGWPEPQPIPLLRDVLELVKGRAEVYIEIKPSKRDGVHGRYEGLVEAVMKDVRAAGMLKEILVISFDWAVLPTVKALEPAVPTGALLSDDRRPPHTAWSWETLFAQVKTLGSEWINMDYELCTSDVVKAAHKAGFKLGLWTVDELEDLRRFAADGVDSLTSDRPDLFAQI